METPTSAPVTIIVMPSPSSHASTQLPSLLPAPPPYPYATPSPSVNSPLKPPKKYRSVQEKILRCKRKIEFEPSSRSLTQLRRNERERKRVGTLNNTFTHLRKYVPDDYCNPNNAKNTKKLSKVDTLRGAIGYIKCLQRILDDSDSMDATFKSIQSMETTHCPPPLMVPNTMPIPEASPVSLPAATFASTVTVPAPTRNALQPINVSPLSNILNINTQSPPEPEYCKMPAVSLDSSASGSSPKSFHDSDYSKGAPLSPEEKDLLSFASIWLQDQTL